jgi:hypothetical protein
VLPAKSLSAGNFRASREPEQCVQCGLHENHAKWPMGWDRSTWDVPVSRGAATCGARTDCSGEPDQNDGGGLAGSQWGGVAPLPHSELRRAVKPALPKSYWVLTAGVYTASGPDMQRSESMLPNFDERDPIVPKFLRLPAQACYASAALFATGINFLGWKMARSERRHKIWWVPQVATTTGNFAGSGYTRAHPSPH